MKVMTVLGARPQFIKAATVSRVISTTDGVKEIIVHTGQHFDENMSEVFFKQLNIPAPHHNLCVGGLPHGAMTGRMLEGLEDLILREQPDWVLVYGDTNSTLAGALAATKLHVPIAHIEAGLRSNNPGMPEEINRIVTDRLSTQLLCPTSSAVDNLINEGFPFEVSRSLSMKTEQKISNVGDVMFDAVLYYQERAKCEVDISLFGIEPDAYILCTLHRQENTDNEARLLSIISALAELAKEQPVVLPLHPRTKKKLAGVIEERVLSDIMILDPVPYLDMQALQMGARVILTDSGGMQKEALFHGVPCVTMRDETEWEETLTSGWNRLVGAGQAAILEAVRGACKPKGQAINLYGDGAAAEKIVGLLTGHLV